MVLHDATLRRWGELRPSLPPSGVGAARLGGGKGERTGRGNVGVSGDALSGVAVLFISTTTTTTQVRRYSVECTCGCGGQCSCDLSCAKAMAGEAAHRQQPGERIHHQPSASRQTFNCNTVACGLQNNRPVTERTHTITGKRTRLVNDSFTRGSS